MKKYKIGYTTGVFDLFHIGHLNILRRAKERCAYLIVGVSTDECVIGYKHRAPIIPFDERIEIVKAIKFVDEVVPQDTMDKMIAWNKLRFDVMYSFMGMIGRVQHYMRNMKMISLELELI